MDQSIELLRKRAQASGGDALLEEAADDLARMRTLAVDAYVAWGYGVDAMVGELLRAMVDDEFCQTCRPDLWAPLSPA